MYIPVTINFTCFQCNITVFLVDYSFQYIPYTHRHSQASCNSTKSSVMISLLFFICYLRAISYTFGRPKQNQTIIYTRTVDGVVDY